MFKKKGGPGKSDRERERAISKEKGKSRAHRTRTVSSASRDGDEVNTRTAYAAAKPSREHADEGSNSKRKAVDPKVASKGKELVHSLVQQTLTKGVMGLRQEFMNHKRINDLPNMTVFSQNAPRNRYKDVGCLDATRVQLKGADNDYIHANYVSTPTSAKRFICCQAPLDSTIVDHWRMIVQEKSEVILMLCNLTEKGAKKCAQYFPNEKGETVTFEKFSIRAKDKTRLKFPFTTTAVINVTHMEVTEDGRVVHELKHYHWVDWPDRGVPPADAAPIWLLKLVMVTQTPVIVHCSAGIGRTGSVVLIQYTLESIAKGEECKSIEELMLNLRRQRANSVQTDQQYLYVHQVLLNHFQKEGYLDKSVSQYLEKFRADYKKAVITGG